MRLDEQEARVVLGLSAAPQWRDFMSLAEKELERVRFELESASPDKIQHLQGRAKELRSLLGVRATAEAVLTPKTPIGTL